MKTQRPAVARVARKFGASPERVFDAWLDPAKVPIWWKIAAAAAGRGATETLERVVIDAHVGGSFSILVKRDAKLIDHTGTYLEIERPRRLAFTWAAVDVEEQDAGRASAREGSPDYSRVIIEIAPLATGCEV
ncbi:MAG: SRPBCC family protein, partial [Gemmatimonadaceae bacterium]